MGQNLYQKLTDLSLTGSDIDRNLCHKVLKDLSLELLPLLHAAFSVRKVHAGKAVSIHILNNVQNGFCPENCHYCIQANTADSKIAEYPLKTEEEIFAEAKAAYEKGAFRYCMVFAGRGPTHSRVEKMAGIIRKIKQQFPIEVCISTGLIDQKKAKILKSAGLDRLNHNLNTSEQHYPQICTSHTYAERIETLNSARSSGIQLCSGIIVGMGESENDIIDVANTLRNLNAESIPVNFFLPVDGHRVKVISDLTPEYCLRILCLFRFLNPNSEIRIAAGREFHLRSMEVMALYPANSLFLEGYLNVKGSYAHKTLQMIKDAGFTIKSDQNIDHLIQQENLKMGGELPKNSLPLKSLKELRPHIPCPETNKSAAQI